MVNICWCYPTASLRAGIHSSKVSSASLRGRCESFRAQHHLTLEASWTLHMLRKAEVVLRSKEESQHQMRRAGSDPGILLLQCVGSGCQAVGQKRVSLNPCQNSHHSVCCKAEEVQTPLILHPKPTCCGFGPMQWEKLSEGDEPQLLCPCQFPARHFPSQRNTCCNENENENERKAVQE